MVFTLEEAQALEESVLWEHHEEALERINERYEAANAQLRGYSEIIDHQNGLLGGRADIEEDNLDLMEALLIAEGFETIYRAASGPEAFAVLGEKSEVGVVLLDMMMPGMDGHEVCRRITRTAQAILAMDAVRKYVSGVTGTAGSRRVFPKL